MIRPVLRCTTEALLSLITERVGDPVERVSRLRPGAARDSLTLEPWSVENGLAHARR